MQISEITTMTIKLEELLILSPLICKFEENAYVTATSEDLLTFDRHRHTMLSDFIDDIPRLTQNDYAKIDGRAHQLPSNHRSAIGLGESFHA
jgi:hypothetical protein